MCIITGDGGNGKGSLPHELQYKDPIVTNTYRYRAVPYYCRCRTPALKVTLHSLQLALNKLAGYRV